MTLGHIGRRIMTLLTISQFGFLISKKTSLTKKILKNIMRMIVLFMKNGT